MGFLNWFKNNEQPENCQESQLDLLGQSQAVRGRVDGTTIRKDFTQTIKQKGASNRAHGRATAKMTQELFGCSVDDLYRETGGKMGDRSTLPQDAQTAYMMGEVAATHRLKNTEIGGNQQQRDEQVVDTTAHASQQVKGLFPWNW